MRYIFLIPVLALASLGADAKAELQNLQALMDKANSAKDGAGYVKHLTADYFGVTRTGILRNRAATADSITNGPAVPADLKREILSTTTYGDTVIQLAKETATGSKGTMLEIYVTLIYVKQSGEWKLAARTATNMAPAK